MKFTLYVILIANVLLSACTSKVDEVTAPVPMSPDAEPAGWSRARTWTPTTTRTPDPRTTTPTRTPTRTPTATPTPPINLNGQWYGTFTYGSCIDRGVPATIVQGGSSVWGYFPSSCLAGPPGGDQEIDGTLQGNILVVALWDGDILLGTLTGPVSSTAISVWNSSHTIGLVLTR